MSMRFEVLLRILLLLALGFLGMVPFGQTLTVEGTGGYYNPNPTGVIVPTPNQFHSYDTLTAELMGLNASQSGLVKLEAIGTSVENRTIWALRLTNGTGPKNNIFYMGLHESNEWMSLEVPIYLIHYFLANAKTNPRVQAILQRANLWFIPLVNPDGYEYSRVHDNLWRKNRRVNPDETFGVDINRNYGFQWGVGNFGANTSDIEYRGPEPFSEPETVAVRDFALSNHPVLSLSYHTAGGWVLFPWSYTPQPSQNDGVFRGYALEMFASNGYRLLQEGRSNHVKSGNSDDWLYHMFGTIAFTIELGPAFSSQDTLQIDSVLTSNIEPAILGAELSLHLRDLSCAPRELLCVPTLSVVVLGIPLLAGSVYFGARIARRRREQRLNPDLRENADPASKPSLV